LAKKSQEAQATSGGCAQQATPACLAKLSIQLGRRVFAALTLFLLSAFNLFAFVGMNYFTGIICD